MKILKKYTSFTYTRSLITNGRIILVDEPISLEMRTELKKLETVDKQELLFLEDKELAVDLEKILKRIIDTEHDILFVFPGNGSNYPYKLSILCQKSFGTNVFAKRIWQPGTDPFVVVDPIFPNIFLILNIKTVLVVDDVISSGSTLQKLYEKNSWRFPQAKWIGVSWVSQIPQAKAKSGVKGYEYIETACVVGKSNGSRVPINSLSTLRQNPEIAKGYAHRHFKNPEEFLRLISL